MLHQAREVRDLIHLGAVRSQAAVEAIRTRYGAVCTTLPHFVAWRQLGKVPSRV